MLVVLLPLPAAKISPQGKHLRIDMQILLERWACLTNHPSSRPSEGVRVTTEGCHTRRKRCRLENDVFFFSKRHHYGKSQFRITIVMNCELMFFLMLVGFLSVCTFKRTFCLTSRNEPRLGVVRQIFDRH